MSYYTMENGKIKNENWYLRARVESGNIIFGRRSYCR